MNLRDRYRKWRSPAQWYDDHPDERKEQEMPRKGVLGGLLSSPERTVESLQQNYPRGVGGSGIDVESDFKKQRD